MKPQFYQVTKQGELDWYGDCNESIMFTAFGTEEQVWDRIYQLYDAWDKTRFRVRPLDYLDLTKDK